MAGLRSSPDSLWPKQSSSIRPAFRARRIGRGHWHRRSSLAQTIAQRERHIIRAHDVANLIEPLVEKTFLVMREAPARHDRAAARDNAGGALGGQRHIGETHAGMDREIIDALLGLLDQCIAKNFPGQLDWIAIDFSSA